MAAPIPDNSYGRPSEEGNRLFVARRGNDLPIRKSKRHSKRRKHRGAKRY
jgi:hypothetical protein